MLIESRRSATVVIAAIWLSTNGSHAQTKNDPSPPAARRVFLTELEQQLLDALGDRLAVRGRERQTLSGTLTVGAQTTGVNLSFSATLDGKAEVAVSGSASFTFDGSVISKAGGAASKLDSDLLGTILLDAPDQLLVARGQRRVIAQPGGIGSAILNNQKTACGILRVFFKPTAISPTAERIYCIDPDSGLPRAVFYQSRRDGKTLNVESHFEGWGKFLGQAIPGRITRFEDGSPVFSFAVSAASFSATN